MIRWIITFLILVFITSALGLLGSGSAVAGVARFLFTLSFIVLVSILAGSLLGPPKV